MVRPTLTSSLFPAFVSFALLAPMAACKADPSDGTRSPGGSANRMRALVPWPEIDRPVGKIGGGEQDAVVIVAIESYDYVPAVPGAVQNATDWQAYFTSSLGVPVERVRLLTNQHATREAIEGALATAAGQAGAQGRVWFVFVGHGAPSRGGTDGLLLGSDVRQTADSMEARGVKHSDVLARLEQSAAQPVVLLDACFSGRTGGGDALAEGLQPTQVANLSTPKRAVVLAAAASDQYAGALPGRSRPAFSYLALGALRGWGDVDGDGRVTAAEVQAYANQALRSTLQGRAQEADLAGPGETALASSGQEAGPDLAALQRALTEGDTMFNGDGLVLGELPTLRLGDISQRQMADEVDLASIDMEKEKQLEAQYLAMQNAKKKVEQAREASKSDPTGEKQKKAWCDLARLEDPNPYRTEAERACNQASSYVEQRRRLVSAMARDWREKVVPFMGLASRTVQDKRKVMDAFVRAYGVLEEQDPVTLATAALSDLKGGSVPKWAGRDAKDIMGEALDFVSIPGGSFDGRWITSFEMARTETTVAQYQACVSAGVCTPPDSDGSYDNWGKPGRDEHPVNSVDWFQAKAFCEWAGGRLPTEQEWEWAARGRGEGRAFPWGSAAPRCSRAVIFGGGDGCGEDRTWPVGSKPQGASRDGLQDMAGNVWEWTDSWYDDEKETRVPRGGSWHNGGALYFRADHRVGNDPSNRNYGFGFRCART